MTTTQPVDAIAAIPKIRAELEGPAKWQAREWILWDDNEDCWGDWITLDPRSAEHFKKCAVAYPKKYQVRPIFDPQDRAVVLARRFHEAYERLAPSFGYQTRRDTREFDPASDNGRLMTAVCAELFDSSAAAQQDAERYRCLRAQHEARDSGETLCVFEPDHGLDCLRPVGAGPGELDAAVDAARTAAMAEGADRAP